MALTDIKVEGLNDIREALLKRLPEELQGKASQIALTKAAAPIIKAARALAPVKTGRLRKAIYSFRDRDSTPTRQGRLISVRNGKKLQKTGRDAYYWRWIEFGRAEVNAGERSGKTKAGTKKYSTGKSMLKFGTGAVTNIANRTTSEGFIFTKHVKAVPARPFLRPAFQANTQKAIDAYAKAIKPAIEKVANRASARARTRFGKSVRLNLVGGL